MNATVETTELVPAVPPSLLQTAIERGASLEVIERLMGLQERYEGNEARKAFNAAFARAKPKLPTVVKAKEVDFTSQRTSKRVHYKYEDYAAIAEAITPVLAEEGLFIRHESVTDYTTKMVSVTTILSHRDGHETRVTLSGPFDESDGKGVYQAIGSAITYLSKFGAKSIVGLAAAEDDDGQKANPQEPRINREQVDELTKLLALAQVKAGGFLKWAKVKDITEIRTDIFDSCKAELENIAADKAKEKAQ